jgi:predicted AAA+ superfamily ATPase
MVSTSSTRLMDELLGRLPAMLVLGPRTAGKTTTL